MIDRKQDARGFAGFLKTLTPEQVTERNERQRQTAEKEAAEFREAFGLGNCSVCGKSFASYTKGEPCLHWLLRPDGFEKDDLPRIAEVWGMGQMQLFLRRVANEEGDYAGHESDSQASRKPHYHFQMRHNGRPYIDYNNFHLPLNANDMRIIEAKRTGAATARYAGGEGMSEIFTDENLERLATMGTPAKVEGEGVAKLDQFVIAKGPDGMRGEDIMAAIQKAKAANKPMTEFLRQIPDASVTTIVSPGPGAVEQALRKGGRKKRRR
jgi:hypothetical protein